MVVIGFMLGDGTVYVSGHSVTCALYNVFHVIPSLVAHKARSRPVRGNLSLTPELRCLTSLWLVHGESPLDAFDHAEGRGLWEMLLMPQFGWFFSLAMGTKCLGKTMLRTGKSLNIKMLTFHTSLLTSGFFLLQPSKAKSDFHITHSWSADLNRI